MWFLLHALVIKRQLLVIYAIDSNCSSATQRVASYFSLLSGTQLESEVASLVTRPSVRDRCKEITPLPRCLPQPAGSSNALCSFSQLPHPTGSCAEEKASICLCFLSRLGIYVMIWCLFKMRGLSSEDRQDAERNFWGSEVPVWRKSFKSNMLPYRQPGNDSWAHFDSFRI